MVGVQRHIPWRSQASAQTNLMHMARTLRVSWHIRDRNSVARQEGKFKELGHEESGYEKGNINIMLVRQQSQFCTYKTEYSTQGHKGIL